MGAVRRSFPLMNGRKDEIDSEGFRENFIVLNSLRPRCQPHGSLERDPKRLLVCRHLWDADSITDPGGTRAHLEGHTTY